MKKLLVFILILLPLLTICKKLIRPLQKKIEKGHLSKSWIEDFTVK